MQQAQIVYTTNIANVASINRFVILTFSLKTSNGQENFDNGQYFSQLTEKSEMVAKFDVYGTLMINGSDSIWIVLHLF